MSFEVERKRIVLIIHVILVFVLCLCFAIKYIYKYIIDRDKTRKLSLHHLVPRMFVNSHHPT